MDRYFDFHGWYETDCVVMATGIVNEIRRIYRPFDGDCARTWGDSFIRKRTFFHTHDGLVFVFYGDIVHPNGLVWRSATPTNRGVRAML
jgi:hypothetical protein